MGTWQRVVSVVAAAVMTFAFAGGAFAQEEGEGGGKKKKQPQGGKGNSGVVESVDTATGEIRITMGGETKTFKATPKTTVTFKGGILDGVKTGDRAQVQATDEGEGTQELKSISITRPKAKGDRGNKDKNKGKGKKKKNEEGGGEGGGEGDGGGDFQ